MSDKLTCPTCGREAQKVIYAGFPMRLCGCSCLFGVFAPVVEWFPIATDDGAFAFMAYNGSYWPALLRWVTGEAASR